ncbi:MAG: UDP-3-O-(3-hydroxymyristoyl)glucosamine N-acyltransferase [Bacteroidales bacterium]|nr:UDP-3-O-(3-hydroxymyristoyl)glucosamine N-acyltransferase [Bacteroidales bacterium]
MEFSASQIAEVVNGKVEGDPNVKINYVSRIEEGVQGTLSFLANPKYTQFIYQTEASIVLVNSGFTPEKKVKPTLIRVDNPYLAFAKLLEMYNKIKLNKTGISEKAHISKSASIGNNVYVGEFAFIGENAKVSDNVKIYPQVYVGDNVKIGIDSTLFAGVKIYADNVVGNNCILHAGAVVGSDGFGFAPQDDKNYMKVAQIGNVIIEDQAEIGSNTTIDRATLGSTIIRKGAKIDNLVQIAHNADIGENTVVAAQSGISGSTKIGKNCMFGGQVGIIGHLTIADDVKIAAQSGVGKNIAKKGEVLQGSPAFEISKYRKSYIHFRNLNDIRNKLDELEKKIKEINLEQ